MGHCPFPSRGKFLTKINSNSHPIESRKRKKKRKKEKEEKKGTRIPIEFLPLFLAPWFLVRLAAFSIFFPIASLPPCRKCILARLLAAPWNADGETHKTTIHLHLVPPFPPLLTQCFLAEPFAPGFLLYDHLCVYSSWFLAVPSLGNIVRSFACLDPAKVFPSTSLWQHC